MEERRLRALPAAAAMAGAVLQLLASRTQGAVFADRPGNEKGLLTALDAHEGDAWRGVILEAGAGVAAAVALAYVLWAIGHRRPLPRWTWPVLVIAPFAAAAGLLLVQANLVDVARDFTGHGAPSQARAADLVKNTAGQRFWLTLLGSGALALSYAWISLQAMRVGLFNGVMGYLGIALGVLLVVPAVPGTSVTISLFWLPALAVLTLDRWPKGRGPAWASGKPERWRTFL